MSNFLKITDGIDVLPLMLAIQRQPELWQEDTFLRHYPQGPFASMETIFLRFPERLDLSRIKDEAKREKKLELYKQNMLPGWDQHESIDYPNYAKLPQARPLIMALMQRVNGVRLGRCMINKLAPGGKIHRHADSPEHCRYWNNRMHIVLKSAPGNDFECDGEHVWMKPGDIYWFDHSKEHEVHNNSAEDRIHLICDVRS